MIKNAVIAGTFDPVTVGHADIIKRAAGIFEKVVVGVFENGEKKTMFDAKTRVEAMRAATADIKNVTVEAASDKTLADFARSHKAVIVKGIRNGVDADYEISLAQINSEIGDVETVILVSSSDLAFVSSTFVRELIKYGKPFEKYVPEGAYGIITKAGK